jgi:ribonuclease M5
MKLKLKQAVVVEGKYDKIKLESILDALIIPTNGFRIFKDKETCALLKALADTVGLLVITDSDVAGFQIRNYIKSVTHNSPNVQNVYIPQIAGKERRKRVPSKEGTLGVEGLDAELLRELLKKQHVDCGDQEEPVRRITKMDFFEDGLCGGARSAQKRKVLLQKLNLPPYLSANALLDIINVLVSYEEYQQLLTALD